MNLTRRIKICKLVWSLHMKRLNLMQGVPGFGACDELHFMHCWRPGDGLTYPLSHFAHFQQHFLTARPNTGLYPWPECKFEGGIKNRLSDKISANETAENLACCRKFCPPKTLVRRKFCPLKSKAYQINTNLMSKHNFLLLVWGNKKPMKKLCRTKLPKFRLGAENFVRWNVVR